MKLLIAALLIGVAAFVGFIGYELHSLAASVAELRGQVAEMRDINRKLDQLSVMVRILREDQKEVRTTNSLTRMIVEKVTHAKMLF